MTAQPPLSAGETDLQTMLSGLTATRRDGTFAMVSVDPSVTLSLGDGIEALIAEAEGTTVVASLEAATLHGWTVDFEAAWITLDVHSALEAVGLTAAFAAALGAEAIPCNVLAGAFHDHILIPVDRSDDALACLRALGDSHASRPDADHTGPTV